MSNVGVLFEIPNEYGNYLADLLEPIQFTLYQWEVYYDEIHLIEDNKFTDDSLFNEEAKIMDGQQLYDIAKKNTYYLIFATLIAYVGDENTKFIRYYQDFLDSNCEVVIGISDCSYVMYWTKDS